MINRRSIPLFIIFVFSFSLTFAQTEIPTARSYGPDPSVGNTDSLVIQHDKIQITFYPNGSANGTINNQVIEFEIPISNDTYLDGVAMAETDSTLIFFYEESITTHSSTHLVIFDKQNVQRIAQDDIAGFNLQKPFFKDNFIYLMTIGFVGKYNLKTKSYSWRHSGLYNRERSTFNQIDQPKFEKDKVIFTSTSSFENITDTLIVNDKSGEILLKTN